MKGKVKKIYASLIAIVLSLNLISAPTNAQGTLYFIEAEDAQLSSDLSVATEIYGQAKPGYSGNGFVWMQNSGTISLSVTVPETGMYSISTRYMQELSPDGRLQYLDINGVRKGSFMLPYCTTWSTFDFGMQKLNAGVNQIEIKSGWGFAYFDNITVDYADFPSLDVEPLLSDPLATPETQILMSYLTDVYGDNTISGQQEIYGSGNDGNYELEFDWIYDLTGKYPAIRGFDFMNYNPLYGWEDGTTDRMIDWVNNRGGIATACWHINVPTDFNTYQLGEFVDWKQATYKPTETNFDTAKAVIPGTKEYEYVMMTIEDLAEQLLILQDNNVPVIFRPCHEAEGNGGLMGEGAWFWWASAGAEVFKELWDMLYVELTQTYGLHNLIWTYNSYTYSTSPAWYPGDHQVDLVGYDKYNTIYNRYDGLSGVPNEDAITSIFYQLVALTDGNKMVAMTENDTIPSLQNLVEESAAWLYFCPWYGEFIFDEANNYHSSLIELYQSDYVITLDELPDLKSENPVQNSTITPTTATFDKNTANQEDITISVNYNGNTLSAIKNGSTTLVTGTDYTVNGNTIVINKEYLDTLPIGIVNLVFDFNAGADRTLAVIISDTTQAVPVDADLGIQFYNTVRSTTTNSISFKYKLTNNSVNAIDLNDITLKYYFTKDGTQGQSFWCDWSQVGGENVIGTFVDTQSNPSYDNYLEISFKSEAGSLLPGQSIELHCRFAKNN